MSSNFETAEDRRDGRDATVATVICRNYRAQARVLASSYASTGHSGQTVVLVLDGTNQDVLEDHGLFRTVTPREIGVPRFDLMASYYSALELSTAVKPWLMEWMLDEYGRDGPVAYFDPDIRFFSRTDELRELLVTASLVLTPHLTEPMPLDGLEPTEQHILLAGVYNLGFVALNDDDISRQLLEWWKLRLEYGCLVDPARGFFVDQRYVDLVPGLFPNVSILRDPTYNVAYWNMSTRPVSTDQDGTFLVRGRPIRFVHYSGFDPTQPARVSRHQNRVRLSPGSALGALFDTYAEDALASGYEAFSRLPYGYATSWGGIEVSPLARREFLRGVQKGDLTVSLFDEVGEAKFRHYLTSADPEGSGVPRSVAALLRARGQTEVAATEIDEGIAEEVTREFGGLVTVASDVGTIRRRRRGVRDPQRFDEGVNLLGYLHSAAGVGEVGRRFVAAIDHLQVPVWPIAIDAPTHNGNVDFFTPGRMDGLPFAHTLVFANADALPGVSASFQGAGFRDRNVTGMWWWELDSFPDYFRSAQDELDRVIAGSRFLVNGLRAVLQVPVHYVPVPISLADPVGVDRSVFGSRAARSSCIFYFTFDYHSVFKRKNPLGLVEAFASAFPVPGDDAHLVIKTINQEHYPEERLALEQAIAARSDVSLVEGFVSPAVRDLMMASCDCYVSLHRSEGLGMTLAEAMFARKPVIATAYSGNLDFMDESSGLLIDYEPCEVGAHAGPYPPSAMWAEPDLDAAARALREISKRPQLREDIGRRAGEAIRVSNSVESAAVALQEVFA